MVLEGFGVKPQGDVVRLYRLLLEGVTQGTYHQGLVEEIADYMFILKVNHKMIL